MPRPLMAKFRQFIASVKSRIDSTTKWAGQGSQKKGVKGTLERSAPWVYPDDPVLAPIPDRDTHAISDLFSSGHLGTALN